MVLFFFRRLRIVESCLNVLRKNFVVCAVFVGLRCLFIRLRGWLLDLENFGACCLCKCIVVVWAACCLSLVTFMRWFCLCLFSRSIGVLCILTVYWFSRIISMNIMNVLTSHFDTALLTWERNECSGLFTVMELVHEIDQWKDSVLTQCSGRRRDERQNHRISLWKLRTLRHSIVSVYICD